ncbi:cytosolic phospholipase A2 gamma [Mergus octosetaceus]
MLSLLGRHLRVQGPAEISMGKQVNNEVRLSRELSEGEIKATKNRRGRVQMCLLEEFGVHFDENNVPNIVVLGSGGGLRAMIALLGTLVELKNQNILDAVMYLCGVSGSTWCMSMLYTDWKWSEKLKSLEESLIKILTMDGWDIWKAIEYLEESSEDENYSLTDVWACVVYKILHQFDENKLTDYSYASDTGINPYPIYAAVDKEKLSEAGASSPETWFEFTSHEAGYTALGAFVSTENFGSKFENGKLMEKKKKKTICYMQGLWGSAFGSMEEILKAILESMSNTTEFSQTVLLLLELQLCAISGRDPEEVFNKLLKILSANIQSSHLVENKTISLIDAGLAINSAYPLVLKKQRQTDLILSFDFSSGDPFETVEKAADYCHKNGIPFPKIEKQEMDKESPSDCYIFQGDKSCPTVMHFPLFNKVNCSGNIYLMLFCLYVLAFHIFNFWCQAFESPLLPSAVVNGHRRKGRE